MGQNCAVINTTEWCGQPCLCNNPIKSAALIPFKNSAAQLYNKTLFMDAYILMMEIQG